MSSNQSLSETPTSGVTQSTLVKPHQSSKPIMLVFLVVIIILSLAGNIYLYQRTIHLMEEIKQAANKMEQSNKKLQQLDSKVKQYLSQQKELCNKEASTCLNEILARKTTQQDKLVRLSYKPPYSFSWSLEGGSTLSLAEVSLGEIPSPGIGLRKPFTQEFSKPGEEVRALVLRFKLVGGTRQSTCIPTNWILVVTKEGDAIPPSNTAFNCVGSYQTIFDNIYFVVPSSTNYFILRKEPGTTSEDSFEITLSDGSLRVERRVTQN